MQAIYKILPFCYREIHLYQMHEHNLSVSNKVVLVRTRLQIKYTEFFHKFQWHMRIMAQGRDRRCGGLVR